MKSFEALTGELQQVIDAKTKPPGSLGQLETLAIQLGLGRENLKPRINSCELLLFAADHGIAAEGVSAFPQSVTRQMVHNFLAGGAAANVFAEALGITLKIIDSGVLGEPIVDPKLLLKRLGPGTKNALYEPAMSAAQRDEALAIGAALAEQSAADVLCLGEMGIGNTSSSSLLAAKLLDVPIDRLIGRGTGVSDAGLAQKTRVLQQAAARTSNSLPAKDALAEYGGFEIVMLSGAMLGAITRRAIVIVDGFIATAAALAACRINPAVRKQLVFAHRSQETGHRLILQALNARPLLDLDLRLGEGSGALLAWPLVKAAAAMLNEMATFSDAGVDEK